MSLIKAMLLGICMLILINVLINYISNKIENVSSTRELSIAKLHKYNISTSNNVSSLQSDSSRSVDFFAKVSNLMYPNESTKLRKVGITHDLITREKNYSNNMLAVSTTQENYIYGQKSTPSVSVNCKDPTPIEGGPITPNTTVESLDIVENELKSALKPGGAFEPIDCKAHHHVAIVVPFRDRYAHLSVFLRNIHPFLMRQRIAYRIFIVEQTNGKAFNRAALMNIGFLEALKLFPWDCFIFHDVDLIPLDTRNLYNCPRQPRHMSVAIDSLNFKLPYRSIFGGVSAMSREHFQMVNGFSNSYFGWGGEDDDMSNRLKHANLFISRYPINIARYMMLKHQKEKANPKRYENLVNGVNKIEMDGLNSIKYMIYSFREFPIFTWYLAELQISNPKR